MTTRVVHAAALAAALLSAPATAQEPRSVLRVVPQADVAVTDPVFGTAWISTIHGTMVWESLFAWDSKMQPQPQMVSDWGVSEDGLRWYFTLREGVRFHDGSSVTTTDVIASLRRWMTIDATATRIAAVTAGMDAVDDRTFQWTLREPFPAMVSALAAAPSRFAAIMRAADIPERGRPATTLIGSGPFRFNAAARVSGDRVVYDRNPDYVPRAEPPDGLAGGRVVKVDRVEFRILPDPATAAAALQAGEVDFIERPSLDLLPVLSRSRAIRVTRLTDLAGQAMLRPNTLHPPFNDVRARAALAYIVDQAETLAAGYGDETYWSRCNAFFVCGSPNGTEAGAEGFGRDLDRARQLLNEAGYRGERIVFPTTTEIPFFGRMAEVTAAAMRRAGMNVDLQWMDWPSVITRTSSQAAPAQGGWNIYVTGAPGPLMWSPMTNIGVNTACDRTNFAGWPCDEAAEALRREYINAADADRPALLERLHRRLAEVHPYRLLGQSFTMVAYRTSLSGVLPSPVPVFWNIEKR
ncbi:ABC transporter substrate-binding protein [Roseomonas sp. GCM10028921]